MNIQIYGIESQILKLLSESEGNILDNTTLIETLAEAKASRTTHEVFSSVEGCSEAVHVAHSAPRDRSVQIEDAHVCVTAVATPRLSWLAWFQRCTALVLLYFC